MSKTTIVGKQKITTYADESEKEEEFLKHHADRRAQNMKLKSDAGKAPVTPSKERPDARKNLPKEEPEEEEEEEQKPKPRKQPKRKEPSTIQNIGRNVGNYVAKNSGMPSWLGRGGGMPPAMRMGGGAMPPALRTGVGKLPPAYSMGMGGEPPTWLFGGMPGAPAPAKGKKQKGNGLPSWFRY